MGKKLSLQDVKNFLKENDVENKCTLLSTEYINSSTPLLFRCNLCGKTFERDWNHVRRKRFTCTSCGHYIGSNITIETVKKFIEENDKENQCTLLSTQYRNSTTPLDFRCNVCGKNFTRNYQHLTRDGGRFRCPKCGITAGARKIEYTPAMVDEAILKRGYRRIGEYVDASTPFQAICKRGHEVKLSFSNFLLGHSGCKICANIERTEENSPNWKGGESEVIDSLRKSLKKWKKDILMRDNFLCQVTNCHDNLVVHHLVGFNTIIKEASEITGIPVLRAIKDYSSREDYQKLQEKILELHTLEKGITLTRSIHNDFHQKYGKGNNTPEQFKEYCKLNL